MSRTFFTSDQHFWHKNILKFQPNRAKLWANIEEMNAGLIERYNATVNHQDTVYMLGDFAFASGTKTRALFDQLHGQIKFLKGNHDRTLVIKESVEAFYPGYHEVRSNGTLIVLNHYAQRVWNCSHHGSIHLYGHSHGTLPGVGRSVDVGVDSVEMSEFTGDELRPWSMEEIYDYMDNKVPYMPDYHNENTK